MKKVYALSILFLFVFIGSAHSIPLINGSFEDLFENQSIPSKKWDVFGSIPGWDTVSGPGIEIQTSGVVVNAQSGNQYVELDSHNNSSMIQIVNLTTGSYILDFWYRPRTNWEGSNEIQVWVQDSDKDFLFTGTVDGISSQFNDWRQYFYDFTIAASGDYGVYFGAVGKSDSYGGFIDNVSLNPAPVPEPGTLLLLGSGLAGLALYRRRMNKV